MQHDPLIDIDFMIPSVSYRKALNLVTSQEKQAKYQEI